jgi:transposase
MTYAAIDLHKRASQIRIITNDTTMDCRIPTTRDRLQTTFEGRERMRILLEAATESEWVAQLLEALGHDVVVADPNYTPMYGERSRRIKTDRRDVAALADACRLGLYRPVRRRSPAHWVIQWQLTVRDHLTRIRTRSILLIRSLARMGGVHLRYAGHAETFVRRVEATELPPAIQHAVTPLLRLLPVLNEQIAAADTHFKTTAATDPHIRRLMSMPGIGPITAAAFVAALDDVSAFRGPGNVASYLGLVPREYSSGDQLRRGRIVPSAHPRVQGLLVEAAWRIWRSANPDTCALRDWAQRIGRRRGKRVAAVALARRVARILYAMWRDQADYAPARLTSRRSAA